MTEKFIVEIDGIEVEVETGTTVFEVAKSVGIKIPTLCMHPDLKTKAGACRMCVVDVGKSSLQASCSYPLIAPMKIKTNTPAIRRARKDLISLLLSDHCGECYTCKRNGNCELQSLAAEYGVNEFIFGQNTNPRYEIDDGTVLTRDMNKCVLCRRCINTCNELQAVHALDILGRSIECKATTFLDAPLDEAVCVFCGQCANRCPTAAITERDDTQAVWDAIDDPEKTVIIQTAPSPRVAIGECFGVPAGTAFTKELNTALRRCGFDKIFDTNFGADLTIVEEGVELIKRLYGALVEEDKSVALPQFTSCSPGWVKYLEHFYPDMTPHLSSAKSPHQMQGAITKTYFAEKNGIDPKNIVSVSLMPCTAKKFEIARPTMDSSGYADVDYAITTRETAAMIKQAGVHLPDMPKSEFDNPMGTATGSGVIFGTTGGVMEAALRSVIEFVTGKSIESLFEHAEIVPVRGFEGVKYAEIKIDEVSDSVPELIGHLIPNWEWLKGAVLKVGVAHGTANARKVLDDIKAGGKFSECHFIEFMGCPGGCIGGGGQPIPTNEDIRGKRMEAIYNEDRHSKVRKSHENESVLEVYKEFLTDGPGGHKAHELLHTGYEKRGR